MLEPEQVRQAGLDEPPLALVGHVPGHRLGELCTRGGGLLVLGDAGAHAHHLGQRPVGDALPVGQAASGVPAHGLRDAVGVLRELPGEPGLAGTRRPGHADKPRAALVPAFLDALDDQGEIARAADKGRLEAGAAPGAAHERDDTDRLPRVHRRLAALDLVRAGVLVDDRRLGRAAGDVIDEHAAGRRDALQPRGGVDGVAEHGALAVDAALHGGPAGQHADAELEARKAHLLTERRNGARQRQRGTHRPLRIVLVRDRRAPDGHDGVADELLDRPAEALDQAPAALEVAAEQLAHLLRVAMLGERRVAHEVREHDRHQPPLGDRDRHRDGRRSWR